MLQSYVSNTLRNKKTVVIVLLILISINVLTGTHFRTYTLDIIHEGDDFYDISIAESFRHKKTFESQFITLRYTGGVSSEYFINLYDSIERPHFANGPMYFMLLGEFYEILNVQQQDLYFYASLLNTILAIIFISLFFLLFKNILNTRIAFASAVLISIMPAFSRITVSASQEMLLYVFAISSFFFL